VADINSLQRLGECLGKGAFGSVYKAFNWGTGEAVAIKQIKIADLPRSELRMIEVCGRALVYLLLMTDLFQAEIDLLKNLHVSFHVVCLEYARYQQI
jgi:serine/threonine protein kinase